MDTKKLSPRQVAEVGGCSLRMAYDYVNGTYPWPAEIAARIERATGISRLHLVWPSEYEPDGSPTYGAR